MVDTFEQFMEMDGKVCLALTGDCFLTLRDYLVSNNSAVSAKALKFLHERCLVYARVKPAVKKEILLDFKKHCNSKVQVMFVGDDVNDIDAMEVADISFLLKNSQLSFKSTFTSKKEEFNSVLDIIKEGKCSNDTGNITFKFVLFQTVLKMVRNFFLLPFFLGYFVKQGLTIVYLVGLFLIGYIAIFPPKDKLQYSVPSSTLFHKRFILNLALHFAATVLIFFYSYGEIKQLVYYKDPFEIIPYENQQMLAFGLDTFKLYEGAFFFTLELLLTGLFFFITNYESMHRKPLKSQKVAFYYFIGFIVYFGFIANLSSTDEPNFFDQFFINQYNIIKTYGTNQIYVVAVVLFLAAGICIENVTRFLISYRDTKKIRKQSVCTSNTMKSGLKRFKKRS